MFYKQESRKRLLLCLLIFKHRLRSNHEINGHPRQSL
nr:MAG TPA: hypothetical protein [Caudoviricetes sp.]